MCNSQFLKVTVVGCKMCDIICVTAINKKLDGEQDAKYRFMSKKCVITRALC